MRNIKPGEINHPQVARLLFLAACVIAFFLAGILLGFIIVSCSKHASKPAATITSTGLVTPAARLVAVLPSTLSPTPLPPTPTTVPSSTTAPPTYTPLLERTPTRTSTKTERPTAQPAINNQTNDPGQCPYNTHLTYGMYAFVQVETNLYDMPRYDYKSGYTDPTIVYVLKPGDRVWISSEYFPATIYPDAKNPQCGRKSYWWYVITTFEDPEQDPHLKGWAFEYYYEHPKDEYVFFDEGYHLGPYKP